LGKGQSLLISDIYVLIYSSHFVISKFMVPLQNFEL
jgi:hypothetical protein